MQIVFALVLLFAADLAHADCPQFYPLGQHIEVANSVELCNSFYAIEYDTVNNRPVISVEKFRSGKVVRGNDFHPDTRIENSADNADYLHSGYDKGHMTPAADATTDEEMHDSFLMSNMTPQQPTLNRQSWKNMEMKVRASEPDYIVTGNIYSENPETIGRHHVPIPMGYYKLVYAHGSVTGYCANNAPHAPVTECSIDSVESLSGLKFPKY